MLVQIHFQDRLTGTSELVAQNEFQEADHASFDEKFSAWVKDIQSRHELPEGREWMVCDETYEGFVWAAPNQ